MARFRMASAPASRRAVRAAAASVAAQLLVGVAPAEARKSERSQVTVVLSDGSKVSGELLALVPKDKVSIRTVEHGAEVHAWSDIREVQVDGPVEEVAYPLDGTVPAPVSSGAAQPPPRIRVEPRGDARRLEIDSTVDCSNADRQCEERARFRAGLRDGVALGYSHRSVRRVKKRPSGSVGLALSGQVLGGGGEGMSMFGAGGSVSVRGITGGRFPGRRGGGWFGFYVEPSLALHTISFSSEQKCIDSPQGSMCTGGDSHSSGSVIGQLGLGVQWMKFGRLDEKDLTQSGFGVALGGTAGYQKAFGEGSPEGSPTYGPQLSLLFPKYNAGTAAYRAFSLNLFLLPLEDFTFGIFGVQYSFG